MRRAIRRLRSRVRGRANDATFLVGCGLVVAAFTLLTPVAGMLAGGAALIGLSIALERGTE